MATNRQVAHAWAHQTGKQRKGFSMQYDGPSIFSWGRHWELARMVLVDSLHYAIEDAPSGCVVLAYKPSRKRSVTTNKHYGYVLQACSHLRVFEVEHFPGYTPQAQRGDKGRDFDNASVHLMNYQAMLSDAKDCMGKAKRARVYSDMHKRTAMHWLAEAEAYNQTFGLGMAETTMDTLDASFAAFMEEANKRQAEANARRAIADREAKRCNRILAKADLKEWLQGKPSGYYRRVGLGNRPWCRVNGEVVETTMGASVPLEVAIKTFRFATIVRKAGVGWAPKSLKRPMVGDFALTRIGPTGNLVIGCHDIPYRYAKLAADLAGIAI